jgi:hypothetical protein
MVVVERREEPSAKLALSTGHRGGCEAASYLPLQVENNDPDVQISKKVMAVSSVKHIVSIARLLPDYLPCGMRAQVSPGRLM